MSNSPIPGLDWPALQYISQVVGFVVAIIAIAVATHKITKKLTSDFIILDGKIKVLEERVNNSKSQVDKIEGRFTFVELQAMFKSFIKEKDVMRSVEEEEEEEEKK
jgi:hypothetical protein